MAYTKPLIGALAPASESCGCNFFINDSGQGVFIYTEGTTPCGPGQGSGTGAGAVVVPGIGNCEVNPAQVFRNNVASVGDGSASVTPLANTGLPGTQPIFFGVPVGVHGVNANVGPSGSNTTLSVDSSQLGVSVLGQFIPIL